ncbi:MAG TPA: DUF2961 domain-containing protein [Bacteroidales bacterium]|nr:DUF2961 domain-containing protein [Bacteroidales bacterium]
MRLSSIIPAAMILLLAITWSCNTGYRTDIQYLVSPGSLPYLKQSKLIQVSSSDSTGGNKDRITLAPGRKKTILYADGPGMIVRIWFAIDSRDPYFLRRLVLRIFWDNEERPSVEVPVGDFFGCGWNYVPYSTQYLGMTSGGYVCYFPMPFERSARIEISNETRQEAEGFLYHIEYQKFEAALPSDVAYFHAQWNRNIRTDNDSNYVLLHAEGKGHLVGMNLSVQSYSGRLNFLEGDEMIFVDGEKRPSVRGTGTEDFFSAGWYFNQGVFTAPYSGLLVKDESLGRISGYRLFIMDPIPFKKNLRFTFEHGHGNEVIADYSSTVYWYQMEPHRPFPIFPVAGRRIPLRIVKPVRMFEAERLRLNTSGLKTRVMDMSDEGPDWGGDAQVLIEGKANGTFSAEIGSLEEQDYRMTLYYTRGPDYGDAEVFINNVSIGTLTGYSPSLLPDGTLDYGNIHITGSSLNLKFVISGKAPLSKGYNIGLDGIRLEPKRVFIPAWSVIGPFPNPRRYGESRRGLDSVYFPERSIDLVKEYPLTGGKTLRWSPVMTGEDGYISLTDKVIPNEMVVSYALTYIYSPEAVRTTLYFGSDDGIKVFLNGKAIYRFLGERFAEPDQDKVDLSLRPGWNTLLLKIENNFGAYGFYARLTDREKRLIISEKGVSDQILKK